MRNRIQKWPVPEAGEYDDFKRCAFERLVVPVLGRNYRLLADDFARAWTLVACRWELGQRWRMVDMWDEAARFDCWVYIFRLPGWPPGLGATCRVEGGAFDRKLDWEKRVVVGEIVVDGECLPNGSVRNWCVQRGIKYVLSCDSAALQEHLKRASQWLTPRPEHHEHPVRISKVSLKHNQYAVYARNVQHRMGAPRRHQHRQKIPR